MTFLLSLAAVLCKFSPQKVTFFARRHLLCRELVRAHGDAVDELHGAPQAVELHTFVDMHHTVGGRRTAPHWILQEAADSR